MKTRLTLPGRILVAIAIAAGAAFAGAAGATASKPHATAWRCVLVRPGDTLWSMARDAAPQQDPRRIVETLQSRNRLISATIQPGAALWVPRRDSEAEMLDSKACGSLP